MSRTFALTNVCIYVRTYYDPPLVVDNGHLLFKTLNNEKFRVETEFSINDPQKFDHVSWVGISALLIVIDKPVNFICLKFKPIVIQFRGTKTNCYSFLTKNLLEKAYKFIGIICDFLNFQFHFLP